MKKVSLSILVVALLFSSICTASAADNKGHWTVTPTAGYYMFDSSEYLDDTPLYGLKLGYDLPGRDMGSSMSMELFAAKMTSEWERDQKDADIYQVRLDLIYPFYPKNKNWVPFVTVGAGGIFIDRDAYSDENPLVSFGAGTRYMLDNNLALRVEARQVLVFNDANGSNFEGTVGLTYIFGKERRKRPEPPKDSDHDGVPDKKDRCPDTPAEFKVDDHGCPINPPDTDQDGVPDYLDKCPGTAAGVSVDDKGCMIDSDGDGVPDELDLCPGNPPGFKVDEHGCVELKQ